jgi:hypothetical protein
MVRREVAGLTKINYDNGKIMLDSSVHYRMEDVTGHAIWAVAQWLLAHYDGEPYEISGVGATYRLTVEKL